MRIAITGATGLIGGALTRDLLQDGHQVVALSRNLGRIQSQFPQVQGVAWDVTAGPPPEEALSQCDAVVHLAGAPLAAGRWTERRKKEIRESRVLGTHNLVACLLGCKTKPPVLINSSAIGFYGPRGDEELDEGSPPGKGFLSQVCQEWEAEALRAQEGAIRVVLLRTGIVLAQGGGALEKMLLPFKLFLGGRLGSGRQWMSWIHLKDEVRLIREAMSNAAISGPLNATAPNPRTNADFSTALGRALGRPAFLPAPAFALKLLMGEMAEQLLLSGQRVLPRKALEAGFQFEYPKLEAALANLLS